MKIKFSDEHVMKLVRKNHFPPFFSYRPVIRKQRKKMLQTFVKVRDTLNTDCIRFEHANFDSSASQ